MAVATDPWMLALDSNAFTYWIDAMNAAPNPPSGLLADEKLALVRIFFWMPNNACFRLVPTVETECGKSRDEAKRNNHVSWAITHVSEVRPLPEDRGIAKRAVELKPYFAAENDRRIVAECELAEIGALLTCDAKFIDRLKMQTRVWLVRPSEFWDWIRIPKGTRPVRAPAEGNPLLGCDWWCW